MSGIDSKLGQLAIARGHIGLGDLLLCVEEALTQGRELGEVLIIRGVVSNAQLDELKARLASQDDGLEQEIEQGNTLVMDELHRSLADAYGPSTEDEVEHAIGDIDLELNHDVRYEVQRELGRGGMGMVFLAADKILKRDVAMKTLVPDARNEKGRSRLLLEAQVTGLLEHPSIVPVYDLRSARDGEPFYTMRVVQEQSLEEILRDIRGGATTQSLTNLVSILRQVSLAVQYAHDLGVVHRDLKPENILVGRYGEVYVIDWGVAKITSSSKLHLEQTGKVVMGQLVGTPHYMAPEQARGDNDAVDERSDVYALGAILYEILTLGPMFSADHVLAILFQVAHDDPDVPTERAPDRNIPSELEEICLRAVRKPPGERYQSAQEFADELELFLEGVKERERREEMASDAFQQAQQVQAVYEDTRSQYGVLIAELAAERDNVESFDPPEKKERLWSLEQQAENLEVEIERRFGEVVRSYGRSLVHKPDMPQAQEALADLYWERFQENEGAGRLAQAAYFESLVRQYNDGKYDALLEGSAELSIQTDPPGATVQVYLYQDVARRLVEWSVAEVGPTPVDGVSVSHGSYLLEIEREGYKPTSMPVLVERGSNSLVEVKLRTEAEIPEDFVYVPAGEFLTGKATPDGHFSRAWVDDFAIARHPVTVGEYIAFLDDLVLSGDEETALEHAPRDKESIYFSRRDDGTFFIPDTDPEGDVWQEDWPMLMVNYFAAAAYADWYASKSGLRVRLPTIEEWEKAARGVDGRLYSWGNHFDASFCLMRGSRSGRSVPEAVGSFPIDRSPYGMMDVCGNAAEWTSTPEEGSESVHYLGGASYNSFAGFCRIDFVLSSPTSYAFGYYGFRLALSLD